MSRTGEVAIVVPVYRPSLSDDERISLRHLNRFLPAYDRYLAMPKSLRFGLDGFAAARFADRFFASRKSYSGLLLTKQFYRAFSDYEHILLYQLDSLVFVDELPFWCARDYDFIGAVHVIGGRALVGNGGFSLRRVASFLEVLESKAKTVDADEHWNRNWAGQGALTRFRNLPRKYLKRLRAFNGVGWEIRRLNRAEHGWPEDWFWSLEAAKYWPEYRTAPNEEAHRFAFYGEPRETYEAIGRRLPFGCHGWTRFDREFWEPHLLRS